MNGVRAKIHLRVSESLAKELKSQAKLRNTSRDAIAEAALKTFLSQTEHQAVIDRRLNKLQRQNEKLAQDIQILLETVATFAKIYLVHTPEIPLEQKKRMEDKGADRFEKFVHLISRAMQNDHLFRSVIDERIMEKQDFPEFREEQRHAD